MPDLNIYANKQNLDKLVDDMYKIASDINKNYKLDDDSLELLKE
jgi:L-serine deaminase